MARSRALPDFYVYVLFRENGDPFYIGKGRGKRWLVHEEETRRGRKGTRFSIIRRILSSGIDVPKAKIHEGLTGEVALAYEVALIRAIGRRPDGPLVNRTDGGDGLRGLRHSSEARAKMSAAKIGRPLSPESIAKRTARLIGSKRSPQTRARMAASQIGKTHSPETRAKLAAINLGKKQSKETKDKRAAANRGKKRPPEAIAKTAAALRGRPRSPEHIAKHRAAILGRKLSPEHRAKLSAARLGKKRGPYRLKEGRQGEISF